MMHRQVPMGHLTLLTLSACMYTYLVMYASIPTHEPSARSCAERLYMSRSGNWSMQVFDPKPESNYIIRTNLKQPLPGFEK